MTNSSVVEGLICNRLKPGGKDSARSSVVCTVHAICDPWIAAPMTIPGKIAIATDNATRVSSSRSTRDPRASVPVAPYLSGALRESRLRPAVTAVRASLVIDSSRFNLGIATTSSRMSMIRARVSGNDGWGDSVEGNRIGECESRVFKKACAAWKKDGEEKPARRNEKKRKEKRVEDRSATTESPSSS